MPPRKKEATQPKCFVPSRYGNLSIPESSEIGWCTSKAALPRLQFQDADLLIKLPKHHWLLLHTAVVANVSPVLRASFSDAWAGAATNKETITHPVTGKTVTLRTLALRRMDSTFLLEGKDVLVGSLYSGEPNELVNLFQDSDFAEDGFPVPYNNGHPKHGRLGITRRALHILFALMYGAELDHEDLTADFGDYHINYRYDYRHEYLPRLMNQFSLDIIAAICAYGEYYQCLEFLKPAVYRMMQSCPKFWKAVAFDPRRHCILAKRLENPMVFFDALRHMVAQSHARCSRTSWSDVADALCVDEDLVREFFPQQLDRFTSPVKAFNTRPYKAYTTFFRSQDLHKYLRGISEGTRSNQAAEYLARTHFGQWLVNHLYGDIVFLAPFSGNVHSRQAGSLNVAVHKLEKGVASDDPAHVFGLPTSSRLSSLFSINKWLRLNPTKQIRFHLHKIVKDAGTLIQEAYDSYNKANNGYETSTTPNNGSVYSEFWDDWTITCHSNFDAHEDGYFTFMPMPCTPPWSDEPWEGGEYVPPEVFINPVEVDMTEASKAWVDTLGERCGVSNEVMLDNEIGIYPPPFPISPECSGFFDTDTDAGNTAGLRDPGVGDAEWEVEKPDDHYLEGDCSNDTYADASTLRNKIDNDDEEATPSASGTQDDQLTSLAALFAEAKLEESALDEARIDGAHLETTVSSNKDCSKARGTNKAVDTADTEVATRKPVLPEPFW